MSGSATTETATRVVLSYDPEAIDGIPRFWVEDELSKASFEGYISRAHDTLSEGEAFEASVSKGCGVPVDVTLRVERLEGGSGIGEKTTVEVRRRE